nr:MADS-box protein SVP-like [Ipomoea batatas]
MEQKLEVGLNRVSETKDEQFRNEIATLQYKGAELMEENNWLKQRVANDRQNGRIVPGMDRMILDEGQTSESITNNSTTQPPLQAAHCSDTLLKLGLAFAMAPVGSLNQATAYESPAHSSTGTRSEPRLLPLLGSLRFHVLFHSPLGVLFTLPSRQKMEKKVMYPALIKAMLDCKDGGVWFKRLFMVLVCSMFIETQQNGTVGIQVLYYLDDVLSIPRMNWCSFVMNVLMETSVEWLKERSFTLIALCYSSVIFLGHFQHL